MEKTVEQRLERLEVHVEHIQADVTEIKGKLGEMDLRLTAQIKEVDQRLTSKIESLDEKLTTQIKEVDQRLTSKIESLDEKLTTQIKEVDQRLTGKLEALDGKLTGKIDDLLKAIGELKVARFVERVWYMLMSAGLLWVIAKAFKWI